MQLQSALERISASWMRASVPSQSHRSRYSQVRAKRGQANEPRPLGRETSDKARQFTRNAPRDRQLRQHGPPYLKLKPSFDVSCRLNTLNGGRTVQHVFRSGWRVMMNDNANNDSRSGGMLEPELPSMGVRE